MDHVIINMPDRASAESLAAAIRAGGGMEHPERKGVKSGEVVARRDEWGGSKVSDGHGSVWIGSSGRWCVEVSFPPPPDIPALIAKWHADPTCANKVELANALAPHRFCPYIQGNVSYRPTEDGQGIIVY